jgi:hypothetical protein
MSPINNQDVVFNNLIPRADCIYLIQPPPIVLNTPLTLINRSPNVPADYRRLPFNIAVGSDQVLYRNFRSNPTPDGPSEQTGYVQVQNIGAYDRRVYVYGIGLDGTRCVFPTFTVPGGTSGQRFKGTFWFIQAGYSYFLALD